MFQSKIYLAHVELGKEIMALAASRALSWLMTPSRRWEACGRQRDITQQPK